MGKKNISDFLHDEYAKDIITKEQLNQRIKWLDEHYDDWHERFTEEKQKMFGTLVVMPQNLLCNLTFLDLCIDHGEMGAINAMIIDPRGKKIFDDSLQLLEIYFMFRTKMLGQK
jgi:hypothetical protein